MCVLHWRFRLPRDQIGYVRFIVESYEGVAQVSSEPRRDEIEWIVPQSMCGHAQELADALCAEGAIKERLAE